MNTPNTIVNVAKYTHCHAIVRIKLRLLHLLIFCGVSISNSLGLTIYAQTNARSAPNAVPVVFEGDTLFYIADSAAGLSPQQRAALTLRHLDEASGVEDILPGSLSVTVTPDADNIRYGMIVIHSVTDADAQRMGIKRKDLTLQYKAVIEKAIQKQIARSRAEFQLLIIEIAETLLATALLLLIFWFLNRLFRRAQRWIIRHGADTINIIKIRGHEVLSNEQEVRIYVWVARWIRNIVFLVFFYFYLTLTFSFFPQTRDLAITLLEWVKAPIVSAANGIIDYAPKLFTLAVILVLMYYVLRLVRYIFDAIATGGITIPGFFADWAKPTYSIVKVMIFAFTLVIAAPYLPGSDTEAFKGISIFVGILFSLGSSSAVSNLIAGVIITYMRPFNIGDRVVLDQTIGDVTERNLLVTRLLTIKNEVITIPNSVILNHHIINYSIQCKVNPTVGLIVHTTITIGYDTPPETVKRLLIEAALMTPNVQRNPEPFVLVTGLNDFYVSYQINAYTLEANLLHLTQSELHQRILHSFHAAGVEIMSPHYTQLRDGNHTTIPSQFLDPNYKAGGFRMEKP